MPVRKALVGVGIAALLAAPGCGMDKSSEVGPARESQADPSKPAVPVAGMVLHGGNGYYLVQQDRGLGVAVVEADGSTHLRSDVLPVDEGSLATLPDGRLLLPGRIVGSSCVGCPASDAGVIFSNDGEAWTDPVVIKDGKEGTDGADFGVIYYGTDGIHLLFEAMDSLVLTDMNGGNAKEVPLVEASLCGTDTSFVEFSTQPAESTGFRSVMIRPWLLDTPSYVVATIETSATAAACIKNGFALMSADRSGIPVDFIIGRDLVPANAPSKMVAASLASPGQVVMTLDSAGLVWAWPNGIATATDLRFAIPAGQSISPSISAATDGHRVVACVSAFGPAYSDLLRSKTDFDEPTASCAMGTLQ